MSWNPRSGILARHLEGPVQRDNYFVLLGPCSRPSLPLSAWLFPYFSLSCSLSFSFEITWLPQPQLDTTSQFKYPNRDWLDLWDLLSPPVFLSPVFWPKPVLIWVFTFDLIDMAWSQSPGACCSVRQVCMWEVMFSKNWHGRTGKLINRPTGYTSLEMLPLQI